MAKRSKLYKAQLEKYDKLKLYPLAEAVKLLKELPAVKFDQTVELSFKLGVDPSRRTRRSVVRFPCREVPARKSRSL